MAECIAAVLAGFIGMYFAEYKGMDESLQNCVTIICSINNKLILEKSQRIIVTNGAIVIHTQRLKSDPGGNLLS